MGRPGSTDVLLALADVAAPGIDGYDLLERLGDVGIRTSAASLLVTLLRLEAAGHVAIDRADPMRFAATEEGRRTALDAVGGDVGPVVLVMADLVDFTSVTIVHGDETARAASSNLARAADRALRSERGAVVKSLGDGFLGWLPAHADPAPVLRSIAQSCALPDGAPWPMRAAGHLGSPIRYRGDLYGADVNLVARLCDEAAPDEVVVSIPSAQATERLVVRGIAEPVPVARMALR
jgi:class 3 adenylate cyclase